jgi:hypothetical protein
VRHRCPEQREDAIAGGLHEIPVVAMDGFNHQLESRINDCASLLRGRGPPSIRSNP